MSCSSCRRRSGCRADRYHRGKTMEPCPRERSLPGNRTSHPIQSSSRCNLRERKLQKREPIRRAMFSCSPHRPPAAKGCANRVEFLLSPPEPPQAAIWGRPQARRLAQQAEHLRVGAPSTSRPTPRLTPRSRSRSRSRSLGLTPVSCRRFDSGSCRDGNGSCGDCRSIR